MKRRNTSRKRNPRRKNNPTKTPDINHYEPTIDWQNIHNAPIKIPSYIPDYETECKLIRSWFYAELNRRTTRFKEKRMGRNYCIVGGTVSITGRKFLIECLPNDKVLRSTHQALYYNCLPVCNDIKKFVASFVGFFIP